MDKSNPRYLSREEWHLYKDNYFFSTYEEFLQHLSDRSNMKEDMFEDITLDDIRNTLNMKFKEKYISKEPETKEEWELSKWCSDIDTYEEYLEWFKTIPRSEFE